MRNKRLLHLEKPDRAQCAAHTEQRLVTSCLRLPKDKSPKALYCGLTGLGETEHAIAQPPMLFDNLDCKLEQLSVQPMRRRTVPISWVDTVAVFLEINARASWKGEG